MEKGKLFKCGTCEKQYTFFKSFDNHMKTHQAGNEKKFKCNSCSKCFKCARDLKVHQRSQTGERPYPCNTCGKGFCSQQMVVIHERSHTGEKPFMCPICNIKMSMTRKIKEHIKKVHKMTWQEAELQTNTKISEMVS